MKEKRLALAIWLVALAVIAGALLLFESDQLWKVQEKNLFLCSALFLKEQLVVPGGLLTWVGTWFTQFLYYPWLGVLLLSAWWLLMMAIIKRAFHIPDRWASLILIPVAILLLTNMDMGYWIYMLKLRGHFFVSTIGTTAVAAMLWGFRCISDKYYLRAVCILITSVLGYPLLGIYGLAAALLMGIWSWRLSASRAKAVICSVVAAISVVAIPLLYYRFVYVETNLANIYWAELPLFYITKEYHTYYIPYYLLAIFFVILTVTYRADRQTATAASEQEQKVQPREPRGKANNVRSNSAKRKQARSKSKFSKNTLYYLSCQAVLAILLVGGVYTFWMKDENFHRELAMQHRIANLDWAAALDVAAAQEDEPTRAIVMLRNLALSRLGRQGDDMFKYKNGSKRYDAPFDMRLMLVEGPLIYYQYGMLNYCNRLCIEMGVEFGFRTEDYKLLVNCALLENDRPLARKYIGILKQTLFHSRWAEQAEALLGHPELIAKDPEREPITHMLHYNNYLGSDQGYTESFLMKQLAKSTYTGDPIFQEQCLLATLWTKDVNQFWYHFYDYVRLHPNDRMPRYYQEAAYLYGMLEGRNDLDKMPFDKSIKDSFDRFAELASQYDNKDVKLGRQALYPAFGETYYYDYVTMMKLPEY